VDRFGILDNDVAFNKIDKGGMLQVVAKTPELLREAFAVEPQGSLPKTKRLTQIVVSGMGGSAIAGDITANLLRPKASLPVYVNRDYGTPAFVGSETLFFALSYSGNTEETLSAVSEAQNKGAKVVCVTSGGKLQEFAKKNNLPLFLIPAGYQPRAALPYLLIPILKSLAQLGLLTNLAKDFDESVALLKKLSKSFGLQNPLKENSVKQLAKKLLNKIPIVLAGSKTTSSAGFRLKTQFNENSKVTALFNVFPEMNHNEIVNLSVLKRQHHNFALVLLRDDGDSERVKKRIEITKSLLGVQLGGVSEICAQGRSALARLLSLVYFGDFLSCYLAVLGGADPTPVDVITRLKKELKR